MIQMAESGGPWWRDFFGSEDSIPLSFFPSDDDTDLEIEGLMRLLEPGDGCAVADICCGAGRHAIRLAERGLKVTGLDASEMMIEKARAAAEGVAGCSFVQGDAARLPFPDQSFDLALNLFNSFGYFEDDEMNQRSLAEVARCLRPGGRFVLETRNSTYQILYAPYHMEVALADGSPAVIRCRYDREGRRLHSTWSEPEGEALYRAAIRLYGVDELTGMFADAGLSVDRVCSSFDGTEFDGWERIMILVGTRN